MPSRWATRLRSTVPTMFVHTSSSVSMARENGTTIAVPNVTADRTTVGTKATKPTGMSSTVCTSDGHSRPLRHGCNSRSITRVTLRTQ